MKTLLCSLALVVTQFAFAARTRAAEGFVAHEWGTFTSVQGADGVQLEWNPLISDELPPFVYDPAKAAPGARRGQPAVFVGKTAFRTLQRMETPVIYFYSEAERTVDVTVKFPQGEVTEWYPQIRRPGPAKPPVEIMGGPREIRWDKVQILPARAHPALAGKLPFEKSGSHYYAARGADADFLRITPAPGQAEEMEKFLFYRGVGHFRAPLTASLREDGAVMQLRNDGAEPLRHLFTYSVRPGAGKFLYVESLQPGETKSVRIEGEAGWQPLSDVRRNLARDMQTALTKEGLFDHEASAMVKTWDDSWFAESGVRVLYTLPRAWTDRILPLTVEPAPREVARVMVGRAELITPGMERALTKQIQRYVEAERFAEVDDTDRTQIIQETRALGLGRFLEPTTRRVIAKNPGPVFSRGAGELLQAASKKPEASSKPLAAAN